MSKITICFGDKNSCSSSLSVWLMLLQVGADFDAAFFSLNNEESKQKILEISPSGKLPFLKNDNVTVWGSLSIGEYLAEIFPDCFLWPEDIVERYSAKSISYELIQFFEFKTHLPFSPEERFVNLVIPDNIQNDISLLFDICIECRDKYYNKGPMLFGKFTIVDAIFAPFIIVFITYGLELPKVVREYSDALMLLPEMKMWFNDV
ncbi:glutathione S-transferase N-terminal domain-containing protein [Gammaproteobacteria bacterium]|nr:glutathione S-transferase N-terminal domain-containing protein [Gammaproteobacteria bacterium]